MPQTFRNLTQRKPSGKRDTGCRKRVLDIELPDEWTFEVKRLILVFDTKSRT